jgi:hypothetical protein
MVTRLEVGSRGVLFGEIRVGVRGGDESLFTTSMFSGVIGLVTASTDLLREPLLETLCRFREECSSSSNGFGRVEQGSAEETARSRDSSAASRSIWQKRGCVHW